MTSPYVLLPSEQLRFTAEVNASVNDASVSEIAEASTSPLAPVEEPTPSSLTAKPSRQYTPLSKEASERIKAYVRTRNKRGLVLWPQSRKLAQPVAQTQPQESADGQYYLPSFEPTTAQQQRAEQAQNPGLLKSLANSTLGALGLGALTPDPPITLEMLVLNKVSVRALIEECRVPITELVQAGVLRTFQDLRELHFRVPDLLRKRELFQAGTLVQLFHTRFVDMRAAGCQFGLAELKPTLDRKGRERKFYPGELETLGVSLDPMIREDQVSAAQLIDLNCELDELLAIGFERAHLELLGITRKQALDPWPAGFGWRKSEYLALCEGD